MPARAGCEKRFAAPAARCVHSVPDMFFQAEVDLMKRSWSWRSGAAVSTLALIGMLLPLSEAKSYPRPPSAAKARVYDTIMSGGYSAAPQLVYWHARARRDAWCGGCGHYHYGHHHHGCHGHGHHHHGYHHGHHDYGYHGYESYGHAHDGMENAPLAWRGEPQGQPWQAGYSPVQIQPGETIVASQSPVQVMIGTQQIGMLNPGQQAQVIDVQSNWVGVRFDQNGQQTRGWVRMNQVTSLSDQPAPPASNDVSAPPIMDDQPALPAEDPLSAPPSDADQPALPAANGLPAPPADAGQPAPASDAAAPAPAASEE